MQYIIPFPGFGNEIFTLDLGWFAFTLRWYALAYIIGIIIGYRIVLRAVRAPRLWRDEVAAMTPDLGEAFVTWPWRTARVRYVLPARLLPAKSR